MAFTKEQRRAAVAKIVANNAAFTEDGLSKLTDNQLVALAEPAKLDSLVNNAKTYPFAKKDDEEEDVVLDPKKRSPREDEEDPIPEEDDEEESKAKKPVVMSKGKKGTTANSAADWFKSAPPEVQRLVANARRAEAARRQELIGVITANGASPLSEDELKQRSTEDLEVFARFAANSAPVGYDAFEEELNRFDFSGASGGPVTNSGAVQPLAMPGADYMTTK